MISTRLQKASEYIKGFACLADCGTDHGKLPIYCVLNGYVTKAYASDNKEKPLENARKNVESYDISQKIKLVLADGLGYLCKEVDVVSILGMGGKLIASILEKADLSNVVRLVLSPNSESYALRDYLEKNNFFIKDEVFVKEKGKNYQIIAAEKGKMSLTETEKEFGPVIIKNKPKDFLEMIDKMINRLQKAKEKTSDVCQKNQIEQRIALLKEIYK
jgi:tRNA (adenine22-N1)-methyltransferase